MKIVYDNRDLALMPPTKVYNTGKTRGHASQRGTGGASTAQDFTDISVDQKNAYTLFKQHPVLEA